MTLRDPERTALASLQEDGIAVAPFTELVADGQLWAELEADATAFGREAESRAPRGLDRPAAKDDYLIRRFGGVTAMVDGQPVARLSADDPWLRFGASESILNVVNAYRGSRTKLVDLDTWYTVPFPAAGDRVASQRWHRDPEDQHVVKVFVYFTDVDEGAGPFQYVKGSAEGGRYGHLWPWSRAMTSRLPWARRRLYPSERKVGRRIPESEVATVNGPAGTVILCDTSGLHRGGFAKSSPRILSYHTYVSPQAPARRSFAVEWNGAAAQLSEQARFALE